MNTKGGATQTHRKRRNVVTTQGGEYEPRNKRLVVPRGSTRSDSRISKRAGFLAYDRFIRMGAEDIWATI
jgi:hypothetical protein